MAFGLRTSYRCRTYIPPAILRRHIRLAVLTANLHGLAFILATLKTVGPACLFA
jgi:hypothetical protein